LLESLLAVDILAFIGVTLAHAVNANSLYTQLANDQKTAANLIADYFEAIKGVDYAYEYAVTDFPGVVIPQGYDVDITIVFSSDAGVTLE